MSIFERMAEGAGMEQQQVLQKILMIGGDRYAKPK